MNSLFLNALKCENTSRPPVWLMRQAGRYLPEYRELRQKHSLISMFHDPEIIAQVTHMPIKRYGFDAAILFSDILMIAEALGVGLTFEESIGPVILRPLNNERDIDQLSTISPRESLSYVAEGIKQILIGLKVPLLGFCGGPFTLASYMIEGGSSKDLSKTKKWMMSDPQSFHKLMSRITHATIEYLNMQIDAGVQAIQIFDSWANYLAHGQFLEFSLAYMKEIIQGLKNKDIPVILFCRGSSVFAKDLVKANPAGISLDWNLDIAKARNVIPTNIAIQGNLDPDFLFAPPQALKKEVLRILDAMEGDRGFIFNLGHGIKPSTPLDSVKILVETVQSHSGQLVFMS
jgi:uroporphyrinogen decarboxylase